MVRLNRPYERSFVPAGALVTDSSGDSKYSFPGGQFASWYDTPAQQVSSESQNATETEAVVKQRIGLDSRLSELVSKEPTDSSAGAPAEASDEVDAIRERIRLVYVQYNPEKLQALPAMFEKYSGQEQKLLDKVVAKCSLHCSLLAALLCSVARRVG